MDIPPIPNMAPPPIPVRAFSIRERLSVRRLAYAVEHGCMRFPISVCYLICSVIIAEMLIWGINVEITYLYSAILGVSATLAGYLWCEPVEKKYPALKIWIQVGLSALIIGNLIYVGTVNGNDVSAGGDVSGYKAAIIASVVAVFFVPVGNASKNWNFTYRQILSLLTASVAGIIAIAVAVALDVFLLVLSGNTPLYQLFIGLEPVAVFLLLVIVFISYMPRHDEVSSHKEITGNIVKIVKYMILPVAAMSVLVWYFCMAIMLYGWDLASGYDFIWTISLSVAIMLIAEYFLWPMDTEELRPFDCKIKIFIPVIMLPLLVWMSVLIGSHICSCGFSGNILYAITVNIWSYIAFVGLIIVRCRRFYWIPISFSAIMLAVSMIPGFNYMALCDRLMRADDKVAEVDQQAVDSLSSPSDSVQVNVKAEKSVAGNITYFEYVPAEDNPVELPDGVVAFEQFEYYIRGIIPNEQGKVSVGVSGARGRLNIDSLLATSDSIPMRPVAVDVPGVSDKSLLITGVDGRKKEYDDSINGRCYAVYAKVTGYVLTKKQN